MSIDWQQRPIDEWPGEMTKYRERSNFKAGWRATTDLLNRELNMLDAKKVVILVALRDRDFKIDGTPRAQARPEHPGAILTFECRYGPLKYACDRFDDFLRQHQSDRAVRPCGALRARRYGITKRGEQYTGWSALPPGTAMGAQMSKDEAKRVLADLAYGSPSAEIDDLEAAYRNAAKHHHPDQGGDPDLFRRATEARDVLVAAS